MVIGDVAGELVLQAKQEWLSEPLVMNSWEPRNTCTSFQSLSYIIAPITIMISRVEYQNSSQKQL